MFIFYPGLGRFFRVRHGSRIVCMSHITKGDTKGDTKPDTKITAGESKIDMVPAFSDGPGSVSLAWGKFLIKLKPPTSRVSRGMGSKLWHD